MSWSYSGDPSSSDLDSIRFEIQDTNPSAPLLQDAEIQWCVLSETGSAASSNGAQLAQTNLGGFYSACARACETLSRLFAMQADTEVMSLRTVYSKQSITYAQRAAELREKASSLGAPYAGGQSWSEKAGFLSDTDRVAPQFSRGQWRMPYTGPQTGSGISGPPFGED